ncbi:MAG TPA: DUF1559 domain-containing protein [Pirellulales bacterium]|nr:DUF1559 domain-containing protein [Pirellulales bacterium]
MRSERRRGYTWVELVAIVCVLVFLLALLLPAVQQARSPGRRNTCSNNMRNLALAVTNYASARGVYPGYLNSLLTGPAKFTVPATDEGDAGEARVTWLVCVLPYLERTDIYNLYRNPGLARANGVDPRSVYLNDLVCPAGSGSQQPKPGSPPPCDYAVNTGRADVAASAGDEEQAGYPADWMANGVFFSHFHDAVQNPADAPLEWISQEYISTHDGSSMTVMLSERLDAGSYSFPPSSALDVEAAIGFVWWPSRNKAPFQPPHPSQRINGPPDALPINRARPSSNHSGFVNVAFCDGHTRSISQDIDYGVWCLLMTPDGRHCNDPGKVELERESSQNNYHFLRYTDVDDSKVQ